ncbi:MAG: class I SAM-dependent methyltransferase [Treponema sp.]
MSIQKWGGTEFLDLGCGEGYALCFFHEKGYSVCGVDFSDYGLKAHNPQMVDFFVQGDLFQFLQTTEKKFDFINLGNVVEHLSEPEEFIKILRRVCKENTVISITVPNDFSVTQKTAFDNGFIESAFWVSDKTSEHFSYFTLSSLQNFVEANGFECVEKLADYPIDFNLFNSRTNYVKNREVGHEGYIAELKIENMLFEQSLEKTVQLHKAYADLGIGRNISLFMKLKK